MTDWALIREGDIPDAIDHLADQLLPPDRPAPKPTTCVRIEVGLRDLASRLRTERSADGEEAPHPPCGDHDHRPPHGWIRPTEERIQNGVDDMIEAMRAARSMNDLTAAEPWDTWKPSKFTRRQWRFFVEQILRADARWRWEHPEEKV